MQSAAFQMGPKELFRPRSIEPPDEPLPLRPFVMAMIRNPISSWSRLVYEQPIVSGKILGQDFAFICGPDLVRQVLVGDTAIFPKGSANERILGPALGEGLLNAEGENWRWQRRAVAPMFRPAEIGTYVPAMSRAVDDMAGEWRRTGSGAIRQIDVDMMATTLAIIVDTMVSGAKAFQPAFVREAIGEYLQPASWLALYDLIGLGNWAPYPGRRKLTRAATRLRQAVGSVIRDRQGKNPTAGKLDLLDRLMMAEDPETGQKLSERALIDNVLTLLMAGHETSATALAWTLGLLANAPHWQGRVKQELRDVLGDEPLQAHHLDKLVLSEQVLKESMRLFPPAALLPRIATVDSEVGGRLLPPGTRIVIPIYAIHRHRDLWDEPFHFDPERFAADREAQRSRYSYLPFGAGPRVCVGSAFAMMEMKIVLAGLLRHFSVAPADTPFPLPLLRVTLRPDGGMALRVIMDETK